MNKDLILAKLETLHKEYNEYVDFYEEFLEAAEERKKEIAKKINDESFEKELEEFVLDAFVLKHVYAGDINILLDRMIVYYNAVRLLGFEGDVKDYIKDTLSKKKGREFKPKFVIENGKAIEVETGFVDEQRKQIKEQGNISKLIERLTK